MRGPQACNSFCRALYIFGKVALTSAKRPRCHLYRCCQVARQWPVSLRDQGLRHDDQFGRMVALSISLSMSTLRLSAPTTCPVVIDGAIMWVCRFLRITTISVAGVAAIGIERGDQTKLDRRTTSMNLKAAEIEACSNRPRAVSVDQLFDVDVASADICPAGDCRLSTSRAKSRSCGVGVGLVARKAENLRRKNQYAQESTV